jgi:hypothetical protein
MNGLAFRVPKTLLAGLALHKPVCLIHRRLSKSRDPNRGYTTDTSVVQYRWNDGYSLGVVDID